MPTKQSPAFFQRRNRLGLGTDIAMGAFKGMEFGLFGHLFVTASGVTVAAGSLTALTTACAVGGAIAIIPAIVLSEKLGYPYHFSFLLEIATATVFRAAFAIGAGCIGAALMGLAITPTVLTALTVPLAYGLINMLTQTLYELGKMCPGNIEKQEDSWAAFSL